MSTRDYLKEEGFSERMKTEVRPFLSAVRRTDTVRSFDDTPLYVEVYGAENARGTVVMLHGFSECATKFEEMIYYFLREGLSVLIYDQRGHARSGRTAQRGVTHVAKFSDYIRDLEAVIGAKCGTLPSPYYLYGHSMGGAVAALYMEKHPDFFKKAVLSSPMIATHHNKPMRFLCRTVCRFCMAVGKAEKPVFVIHKDYATIPFEESHDLSRARFDEHMAVRRDHPVLAGGAPSYSWSFEALGCTKDILKKGEPEKILTAVKLFSAEFDGLVLRPQQEAFVRRLKVGEFRPVQGAKHEIYAANDEILYPYLDEILDFFK